MLLYNDDIIKEYDEVLHRAKFKLSDNQISTVIELVIEKQAIIYSKTNSIADSWGNEKPQ